MSGRPIDPERFVLRDGDFTFIPPEQGDRDDDGSPPDAAGTYVDGGDGGDEGPPPTDSRPG